MIVGALPHGELGFAVGRIAEAAVAIASRGLFATAVKAGGQSIA